MNTKRLFIALPVDPILGRDIFKKFSTLDLPWEKLKKTSDIQLHLTLKFLGETNIEKIPDIISALEKIKMPFKDIELEIDKAQIFNERQPKVLSLHIKDNKNLQALYETIEQMLFDDGLSDKEARRFAAHLTLARVKKASDFEEYKDFNNWQINKIFSINYFELMESELTKTGPVYTALQTFDL